MSRTPRQESSAVGGGGAVAINDALPPEKWRGYDAERRARVRCLRLDLR
jgi:hypothetical protein